MKLNELVTDFTIYMNNEEQSMYDSLSQPVYVSSLNERERVIIDNLIKKSLVSKIRYKNNILVARNEL